MVDANNDEDQQQQNGTRSFGTMRNRQQEQTGDTGEDFGDSNKKTSGNSSFGGFSGSRGRGGGNRGGGDRFNGDDGRGGNPGSGENGKETGGNSSFGGFSGGRGRGGGRGIGGGGSRFATGSSNLAATGANCAPLGSNDDVGAGGNSSFAGRGRGDGSRSGFGGRGGGGAGSFGFGNDRGSANRFGGGDDRGGRRFGGGNNRGSRFGGSDDRGGRFGGRGDREGNGFSRGDDRQGPKIYATEEERARDQSHVPVDRTIDEIFGEDAKVSYQYKGIREEDEEVTVTGLGDSAHQQILDVWADAAFEPKLQENIERSAYIRPRKIQSLTIPLIMDGHDIKGHAETGSGKSAAFLLPIINQIIVKKKNDEYKSKRICPYALIIEPTRELAIQLYEQARKLAEGTGTTVSVAYGKYTRRINIRDISTRGCDILIGTPGRLVDFFSDKLLEFENMKVLVLDEADELLEDSFARDLRQLAKVEGWPKNEDRQTLLFSATFPKEVQEWANDWMKKDNVMVSNRKLVDANTRVIQHFMKVNRADKNNELVKMLKAEEEEAMKENPAAPALKRTMVFVKMKRTADVVSTFLNVNQLKSTTINGDRPQKLREEALNEFRQGKHNIVVTTDVCARGIDIKDLDHVINLDLPTEYVTYVHRIGRTGRLKEGTATSFFDPLEDMDLSMDLVKGCKTAGQEPPDWLVSASEGKLPIEELFESESKLPIDEPSTVASASEHQLPSDEPLTEVSASKDELPIEEPSTVVLASRSKLPSDEPSAVNDEW